MGLGKNGKGIKPTQTHTHTHTHTPLIDTDNSMVITRGKRECGRYKRVQVE